METKRVLITGGNKGIGLETTNLFLEGNYELYILARNFDDFPYKNRKNVHCIAYDISNVTDIKNIINYIGYVDILINNAGIMNTLPYDDYPIERQKELMNINLYAPIELINCTVPSMISKKFGRIVNVTSIAGQIGHPDIWYGVSKAGLINATKSYAKLLAKHGIVVNAIAPSTVVTNMTKMIPEERKAFMKSNSYLNRLAEADEIAKAIFWLATESPEYINGTCIDINNGIFPR